MVGRPSSNSLDKLIVFLEELEQAGIWYHLTHVRDSIMVVLAIPGQRWEVEFFEDGQVEVERFVSTGMEDETVLPELFKEYEEPHQE